MRIPPKARQRRPGPFWAPTERVEPCHDRIKQKKIDRILEDPDGVLLGDADQHDVIGAWDPAAGAFVLRDGNHRLKVAKRREHKLFRIHIVLTAGDETWLELVSL